MKTQTILPTYKILLTALLFFTGFLGFSQNLPENSNNRNLTTLQKYVDGIRQKNTAIKNADSINVMVNDKLVYNLKAFTIDPKRIALVEILVLDPKPGKDRINPSIIINIK